MRTHHVNWAQQVLRCSVMQRAFGMHIGKSESMLGLVYGVQKELSMTAKLLIKAQPNLDNRVPIKPKASG